MIDVADPVQRAAARRATAIVVIGAMVMTAAIAWRVTRPDPAAAPIGELRLVRLDRAQVAPGLLRIGSIADASTEYGDREPEHLAGSDDGAWDDRFTVVGACSSNDRVDGSRVGVVVVETSRLTPAVRATARSGGFDSGCVGSG